MPTLFWVSYAALWLLLLAVGVLVLLLYRHFGVMSLGTLEGVQRDGLPIGSVAPPISGVTADGQDAGWQPKPGQPQLLLFAAPDCEPCAKVLPAVNRLARATDGGQLGIAAVVPGQRDEAARLAAKFRPRFPCLAEDGGGAFGRYRVRASPFAFVVGGDGRVLAKGLCSDEGRLRDLLAAGGLEEAARLLAPVPRTVRHETGAVAGATEVGS